MRNNPQPNEIYRHFKGNLYRVLMLATHSETRETMVVYQALYGDYQVYVRDLSMFMSEVDREKYPNVSQQYRFELIPRVVEPTAMPQQETPQPTVPQQEVPQPIASQSEEKNEPVVNTPSDAQPVPDAQLMQFLDAKTYKEKLNLLAAMHSRITDEMINTMAVVLDLEIKDGDIEERYSALKNCLLMMEKYECSRLR